MTAALPGPRWLRRFGFVALAALLASPVAGFSRPAEAQDDAVPTWRQLAVAADGPEPRWDHTLAADDEGGQLLVFGGRDGAGSALDDTWLFDVASETWSRLDGPAPEPRFGQAVAVDPAARHLYLFGGQSDAGFFNDTWHFEFETKHWHQIETGDSPLPPPRYGTSAVLDGGGHLIISHGFTDEGRFDDTWSLDVGDRTWTEISPALGETSPLKRCLHEAIWDSIGQRMILFGGCSSGFGPCPQGDLWWFDPATSAWSDATSAAPNPSPRSNPALAADQAGERALLFGGLTDAGYTADFWALTLGEYTVWSEIRLEGDGPSPRASHDAVYSNGRLYLFGGIGDAGTLADLWMIDI